MAVPRATKKIKYFILMSTALISPKQNKLPTTDITYFSAFSRFVSRGEEMVSTYWVLHYKHYTGTVTDDHSFIIDSDI